MQNKTKAGHCSIDLFPTIQEVEVGRSRVPGQLRLHAKITGSRPVEATY